MTLHFQHHPVSRIDLLDGFLDGIAHNGLGFFQIQVSLGSHDDPVGRVGEAKSVQKANGGPVDMAVRLNNARKQGPSFQVKHPGVRSLPSV